jgi:hypothetical protein
MEYSIGCHKKEQKAFEKVVIGSLHHPREGTTPLLERYYCTCTVTFTTHSLILIATLVYIT